MDRLTTPRKIQGWLRTLTYDWGTDGDSIRSFRRVARERSADCIEGAVAAAALLEALGHPPMLLDLLSQDDLNHCVAVFREHGKWGSVGISRDPGLDGRKSRYGSLHQLARSYYEPYIDHVSRLVSWGVADLREATFDWRFSLIDLWDIEEFLDARPHRPMRASKTRYHVLRSRYMRWVAAHPGERPTFYRNKDLWL